MTAFPVLAKYLRSASVKNPPTLASVSPVMGEIYANLFASQYALDDISFDVANWLITSATEAFGQKEEEAFMVGTAAGSMPTGIFDATAGGNPYLS